MQDYIDPPLAPPFVNMTYSEANTGEAAIGFQIPRDLFANNLPGLIKELRDLDIIIKFFSEATIGKYEPAEVGSISTTDPLIFLQMAEPVAKAIALAVSWAIGTWYSVEKIRNLRAQTAKIDSFSQEEIEAFFDGKIKKQIEAEVTQKVAEVLKDCPLEKSRKGELSGQLARALEALLAKVERGMTIELRIGPPPADGDTTDDAEKSVRNELLAIQEDLVFPNRSDNPVLPIPDLSEKQ